MGKTHSVAENGAVNTRYGKGAAMKIVALSLLISHYYNTGTQLKQYIEVICPHIFTKRGF
jgi:ADP-ribosylglycohydrolase